MNTQRQVTEQEYLELKKELEQVKSVLIKTPTELHQISEGVKRMGFE